MARPELTRREFIERLLLTGALLLVPRWARGADKVIAPGRRLGIALVGLGSYSTHHLGPAIRLSQGFRLTGVVTGDPAKGARWAREYGFSGKNVYGYDTMHEMAGNPDIDVVYVVTPNGLHAEHTIAAARAGKHVICEKPMAVSVAECDAMIAACRAANVTLSIGYRLHFEPHNLEFMRLAGAGELGPFLHLNGVNGFRMEAGNWRTDPKLSGGGPIMDMGVYVIQAACMAKGEAAPVAVTAGFDPKNRPELFSAVDESIRWVMEFGDGATARCHATYDETASSFRAEGPHGWAELGFPAFYYDVPKLTTSRGPVHRAAVNQQAAQLDGMAPCILAGRPSPAPGEMGRRDVAVIEAVYASARAGGKRVAVLA